MQRYLLNFIELAEMHMHCQSILYMLVYFFRHPKNTVFKTTIYKNKSANSRTQKTKNKMNCHYCPTLEAVQKYHRTPLCKNCFTEQMLQMYTEWENISYRKAFKKIQKILLLESKSTAMTT